MPTYRVTSPEGRTFNVNAPDGATQDEVIGYAKAQWAAPAAAPPEPLAVSAGKELAGVPRQLGLTARYALEGPAQAAGLFTEPIRHGLEALTGQRGQSLGDAAAALADRIGLPRPEGANERVIGDASRLVAGVGGLSSAGRLASAAGGMAGKVGGVFAANPGQQAISAAGAGLAGGAAREGDAGPWTQAGAALAGGLAAPMGASALASGAQGLRSFARNAAEAVAPGAIKPANVDAQISFTLQRAGVDWATVPERIRQGMREEAGKALALGDELNPDALRRLLDFKRTGTTPTRGMLTQDPVQITREMNLAKTGANSVDMGMQKLAGVQNDNAQTLLGNLDRLGAQTAPDAFVTGERVLGALNRTADASRSRIDALYDAARDTQGRSAPLDGAAFTTRASQLLDEGLLGGVVPKSIETKLNQIALGEVPFTVDYAEQLKTAMGKLSRASSDGQQRMALGVLRKALDDTPLRPAASVNPGNLPAVPGTVPPSQAAMGAEAIASFNRARQANAAFMRRVEETPALAAALDDAAPDRFVQQFITGSGANVRDVSALRKAIGDDPQALQAVRANIVGHLKAAATNSTEDITKFSPNAYNKALNQIGDRKLAAFFEPDDIEQLRAVGRAGTLMQAQPVGTAVNNSNSAAMLVGRGMDMLDRIAGKMPLGIDNVIQGLVRSRQQGSALQVPRGLLATPQRAGLLSRAGVPAALYGGLLAAQPGQAQE